MVKLKKHKRCTHETGVFKPAKDKQRRVRSAYVHKAEYKLVKKKKRLDAEGNVAMKDKPNFYT